MPKDPVMLLSYVNLKLRDFYPNLASMCEDMEVSRAEIEEKLSGIGYFYNEEQNQFL